MTGKFADGHTLSINNFDMYYELHGKGEPLLLLHGFTGSGAGVAQGFINLSEKYRVIIPDLRGHGRSTNPSKQFTFRQIALDLFGLLDHLEIKTCIAIGFSGGGCALLQMAYLQPERIQAMSIVSAAPYFPQQTRDIMKQFGLQKKTEEEWVAMRSIHLHGDEQINLLWQHATEFSESYDDMNFTDDMLSKIKTKTFIVQGDRDPMYPMETTLEMYRNIPHSYLWIIPNGGHVPIPHNKTQDFTNQFENFLTW